MKQTWALAAFLISGAAWAQPSMGEYQGTAPVAEPSPAPASVWVQPLSLLTLTPIQASEGHTLVMLPLGANLPLSHTTDLVFEVTPIWGRQDCEARCTTRGLAVAAGTAFTVLSTHRGSGVFIQPKLVGVLARDAREVDRVVDFDEGNWSETGRQLSVGLDVGYKLTRGHFFMAFVLGGSVGRGWNVPQSRESLFFSLLDSPERAREDKSVWDVNLNLVRIGGSF
jgi:hypothetical protein